MEQPPNQTAGLTWTGERYVPEVEGEVQMEHVHRYLMAREMVRGKDVLDIACGEGYGSDLLAAEAQSVVGVDVAAEAVAHAKTRYNRKNLDFKIGTCSAIPVPDASIDVVVSFETIEHHDEHDQMIREIKRVLRPGGLLILSTPNKREYTDVSGQKNPFHVKELYRDELEKLLKAYFKNISLYGQRIQAGSVVVPMDADEVQSLRAFRSSENQSSKEGAAARPVYFIVLASDRPVPALPAGFLEGADMLAQRDAVIRKLTREFEERSQWAKSLDQELHDLRKSYVGLQEEYVKRGEWAKSLDREIESLRQDGSNRQEEISALLGQLAELKRNLDLILGSTSWKMTRPARDAGRKAREMMQGGKASVRSFVKAIYYGLPLSMHAKAKLKTLFYSVTQRTSVANGARSFKQRHGQGLYAVSRNLYHRLPLSPQNKWRLKKAFFKVTGMMIEETPLYRDHIDEKRFWADLEAHPLSLKTSEQPKVSIVIPVYGKYGYTFQCLKSISENTAGIDYEVVVVDDCSTDLTSKMLSFVSGVRVIRNDENMGFIRSCNRGAQEAKGEYVLFLNNDTMVTADWLAELIEIFKMIPAAGLVGAKLVYPDGRLQEAGGIIWRDASGWNYGRMDDPQKPQYNYLREVDYCSGACIMIPRDLFLSLGGFDSRYIPAYAEDADMAFQIRHAGRKILYQPLSEVIHFEGISSGTDLSSGTKKYQLVNQEKFQKKWAAVLKNHRPNGERPDYEKEREVDKRILVIDACTLTPDQDAGSLTVFNHLKIFQSLGYKVSFVPDNLVYVERYTADLQRMGIECVYQPYIGSIEAHLREHGPKYDAVMLCRPYVAAVHIDAVRTYCPEATVIFDTEDLHFIREQRQAELEKKQALAQRAAATKKQELSVAAKADCTIVVNPLERDVLLEENPALNVAVIRPPREIYGTDVPFEDRRGIMFVGGFQHSPNVDAALYFVKEILPRVRARLGDVKFYVIGSRPTAAILSLASENIVVTGYVSDLEPYFKRCRVAVAPIRYGAGIKCKILTSLSYGVPSVATSLACEGMGLEHGKDVLIADEPEDFAEELEALYSHRELWQKISKNGLDAMQSQYSFEAAREKFKRILAERSEAVAA